MKFSKRRKSIISIIILLLFNIINSYDVYATEKIVHNIYSECIPNAAYKHANENYKNALQIVLENPDLYNIVGDLNDFNLCDPYVVYDVESEFQEPLYYFPIVNKSGKIVLVMAVFYTIKGWSDSISIDIADELNEVDYLNEDCIVYSDSNDICIENKNENVQEYKLDGKEIKEYSQKKFSTKIDEFKKQYKVNFNINYNTTSSEYIDILSGFKVSTAASTLLNTDKAVANQRIDGEIHDICWAATFATIYNYIKDKSITAQNVCDQLNHAYTGGSINDIIAAFSVYNLKYKHTKLTLDYQKIREYLKNEKPIYMLTEHGTYGHALTLVGQSKDNKIPYITVWNSSKEKYQAIRYNDGSVSYDMYGDIYQWNGSFCYK